MFIDSDHAGNKWTRRFKTGNMMYMNISLIDCYSKKQSTIETSVFSKEFTAMKVRAVTLHACLAHSIPIQIIVISKIMIEQISMRVQWNVSCLIRNCQGGKSWIHICS